MPSLRDRGALGSRLLGREGWLLPPQTLRLPLPTAPERKDQEDTREGGRPARSAWRALQVSALAGPLARVTR